jgi:hypothetical protein
MLKYAFLIVFIVVSVQLAQADDTNGPEQTVIRKGVYQKLGITSGESTNVPNEEADPSDRQPAQPEQSADDENTTPPRGSSEQPLTSQ